MTGNINKIIADLRDKMRSLGISVEEMAARSGVCKNTIYRWSRGYSARIGDLEAIANSLGYKLAIVPMDKEDEEMERITCWLKKLHDEKSERVM